MPAKVFVSCGQRRNDGNEGEKIKKYLMAKGFEVYLACNDQKMHDTNKAIIDELESSDYYLFVDFIREKTVSGESIGSLYTSQEYAIAWHLEFENSILLRETGIRKDGFINYTSLSIFEEFDNKNDVLGKIEELLVKQKWDPNYSRHLIPEINPPNHVVSYGDHVGVCNADIRTNCPLNKQKNRNCGQKIFACRIYNKNIHREARGVRAILKEIRSPQLNIFKPHVDGRYLKWAGHLQCYEHVIPRLNSRNLDLFCIHNCEPLEIYLHEDNDAYPKEPVNRNFKDIANFCLTYSVFAEKFPKLEFIVKIDLTGSIQTTTATLSCNKIFKSIA